MSVETHTALPQSKPIRLQEYGVGLFRKIATKSALKKAIKKGLITVEGKIASTATFIYGNEQIAFYPLEEPTNRKKLELELQVVFEDEHLAVINKPAGILVSGNTFKTISNALSSNLKKSTCPDSVTPKPVHRLDFGTTGLLLVGKTSSDILALSKLFENRQIAKTYIAVTIGKMKRKGSVAIPLDGKEATSTYEVLQTVVSERFQYLNLVKLLPKTGRKHQLRQHLAALGNPILGDTAYFKENLVLKGKGLYLHAFSLQFVHPVTNENMYFENGLPMKVSKIFGDFEPFWSEPF